MDENQEPIRIAQFRKTLDAVGVNYAIHVHDLAIQSAQEEVEQGLAGRRIWLPL